MKRLRHDILGLGVDVTNYEEASQRILAWASQSASRTVCCANVHMIMEAQRDCTFRTAVNEADLVTSDGMPLVWALRRAGERDASRVYGPDLMSAVLAGAAESRIPVGYYGASEATVAKLSGITARLYPALRIAFRYSPPYRDLTPAEDAELVRRIESSGARILFVGLGCPKQERWMARHREGLRCVQLGVGAAFDQLAQVTARAPGWMQSAGCEWLFRLATEPRRLGRRYLWSNSAFAWRMAEAWINGDRARAKRIAS